MSKIGKSRANVGVSFSTGKLCARRIEIDDLPLLWILKRGFLSNITSVSPIIIKFHACYQDDIRLMRHH